MSQRGQFPVSLDNIDPPAHAVVLSVDEKSQIQALDRTQPGLPIKPGRCGTMTHVWTAPWAQGSAAENWRTVRVRSCVRPR